VDSRTSTAQLDKVDAEKINLLKIDILGLRTLSVLEYVLEQMPKRIDLNAIPLADEKAFKLLNDGRWAGIFQFEGDAVQMLTKQMRISQFSDIVALGALARPGPLNSGGATEWAERRMGRAPIVHLHPSRRSSRRRPTASWSTKSRSCPSVARSGSWTGTTSPNSGRP
jgi:DNA polymerase-3 subunit alpha